MNKYHSLKFFLIPILFVLILACDPPWGPPPNPDADLIFHNGNLITMEQDQPQAQAIAIQGDEIIAVGSDDEIMALAGSETQVIDLGGRTLVPGFIDSHAHWIGDNERTGYNTIDETIQYLLENGWTSINEMFVSQDRLETLQTLDLEGRLKVRVNAYLPVNYREQRFGRPYEAYTPLQVISPHVRLAGVKFFTDNEYGNTIHWTQEELNEEIKAAHDAGWQVAIHTEMVQAHEMVLGAFAAALGDEDNSAYRHRIEHVFGINNNQLEEIRQRGYIASIQLNLPGNFPEADPNFYVNAREEDFPLMTRWWELYDAGVLIAGGTDWPWFTNDTFVELGMAPAGSPLRLIYKAATHTNTQDVVPDTWMECQFLPVEASLKALTINGAYATFEERDKGSLAPGKWADIVILSDNPITVADTDIAAVRDIKVLMTMIGGKVEYCAPGTVGLCPQTGVSPGTVILEPGQAIEIAVQGSVTGSLAHYYPHLENATQMAADDYDLALGGFSVKLVQVDDRCEKQAGAGAATQLLADHPDVIGVVGPLCSAPAMVALPIYLKAHLASISGGATLEELSTLYGSGGYFNRTIFNDAQLNEIGDIINRRDSVQAFYSRYERKYGSIPELDEVRPLLAYSYDAMQVLLHAIETTAIVYADGSVGVNRQALAKAIRSTSKFPGLTGPISFDQDGNRVCPLFRCAQQSQEFVSCLPNRNSWLE